MSVLWIRRGGPTPEARERQVGIQVDADGDLFIIRGETPEPLGGGAGGVHPSAGAHEALGLAPDDHTHDTTHDHEYAAPHAHPYAADDHSHPEGDHPDAAAHVSLGLAADDHSHVHDHDADYSAMAHGHIDYADIDHAHGYAAAGHGHAIADTTGLQASLDGKATEGHDHAGFAADDHSHVLTDPDIPSSIARDAEVTSAIATHAATPHGAGEAFPVGSGFVSFVATNPASLLGYGTWASRGAGRVLIGVDAGQSAGDLLGAATHGHTVTQPDAHAALSHSGATVGNHTFTQPGAHSDHAALAHSAHAGATVGNHTDVTNHVHVQSVNSATTGGLSGYTPDTSSNTSVASGYSTANPTAVGVAAMVHTVGQASAHSDHAAQSHSAHSGGAVDAHSVGQASQHGAQSHTGAAVATSAHLPPAIAVYLWERTA